jgi:hypothetical protein
MFTLHIEHPISDLATWKSAFDRFAAIRLQSGVRGHRIQHPVDNTSYVVIDLDFDNADEAAAFLQLLQTKVWSTSDNSPALIGTPRTAILREFESYSPPLQT